MKSAKVNYVPPEHRIVLIGLGASGRRFLKVVQYAEQVFDGRIRLVGIIDACPNLDIPEGVAHYKCVADAVVGCTPTAAVVSVNEESHAAILSELARTNVQAILCEKPLTTTQREMDDLPVQLSEKRFALNMVERFSPVINDYFTWALQQESLRPVRVQFFWGKSRVRDQRPTMGVMSEIIHPLDLVIHLFKLNNLQVRSGFSHCSDFSVHDRMLEDTVHCKLVDAHSTILSAHASFAWPERRREITAFLRDAQGTTFQAHFSFDSPLWDCDQLIIWQVSAATGARTPVFRKNYSNQDFPEELHQTNKLWSFLFNGLDERYIGASPSSRVDLAQAKELQELLASVQSQIRKVDTHPGDLLFSQAPKRLPHAIQELSV